MIQRHIKSKGKTYLVNCASEESGVGAGFSVGMLVMKSNTDGNWYVTTASGSAGSVVAYVSQSALGFTSGPSYSQNNYTASYTLSPSFFEQNFPYQIIASDDGNAYAVYLTGTPPTVTFVVSQSIYSKAYITTSYNAIIDISKPNLLLQNISNGDYYRASLSTSGGVTTMAVNQNAISQSWVRPIY
jgi:hypothetical protein